MASKPMAPTGTLAISAKLPAPFPSAGPGHGTFQTGITSLRCRVIARPASDSAPSQRGPAARAASSPPARSFRAEGGDFAHPIPACVAALGANVAPSHHALLLRAPSSNSARGFFSCALVGNEIGWSGSANPCKKASAFSGEQQRRGVRCSSSSSPAVVESEAKAQVIFHELPSKLRVEVIVLKADATDGANTSKKDHPSLVFIHGSYHAAWCWSEHWMPFFAARGYDCYAISLLGQGQSDSPEGSVAGTLQSHAADVADVIRGVMKGPSVVVGHSFGGLIVQAYLSLLAFPDPSEPPLEPLKGAVLLCSVPPGGNKDLVMRFLLTKPLFSIRLTLSLAAKMFATNTAICRESFFSSEMPEDEVKRFQKLLADSSKMPLFNLRELNSSLPVPRPPPSSNPPLFIVGGEFDTILDTQALEETGDFFETPFVVVPNIAHDVMLDLRWEEAANVLLAWLEETY